MRALEIREATIVGLETKGKTAYRICKNASGHIHEGYLFPTESPAAVPTTWAMPEMHDRSEANHSCAMTIRSCGTKILANGRSPKNRTGQHNCTVW